MDGVELYLFRAVVPMKKLDIRLDKVTDKYGSPSIDDIEKCVGTLGPTVKCVHAVLGHALDGGDMNVHCLTWSFVNTCAAGFPACCCWSLRHCLGQRHRVR